MRTRPPAPCRRRSLAPRHRRTHRRRAQHGQPLVRDIELTLAQTAALDARNPARNAQLLGARNNAARRREERSAAQAHGRALGRSGGPGFAMDCMLYWGEGSKNRNEVILVNSDADLLATFLGFLRRFYGVADAQIAFSVNCFLNNGPTLAEIEGWWRGRSRIPLMCMRAATVNRPSSASGRRRYRVLIHGTGRLVVHSTFIVQSIYGGIQELAGIERPEWLDL
jgi:hypothetical protein